MIEHPHKQERLEERRRRAKRDAEQYQATLDSEQERIDAAISDATQNGRTKTPVRVRLRSGRIDVRDAIIEMYVKGGWDVSTETRTLLTAPPQFDTTLILS